MSTHSTFSNEDAHYYEVETAAASLLYAILNLQGQMEAGIDQTTYQVHFNVVVTLRDHLRELVETLTRYDPAKVEAFLKRADREFGVTLEVDLRMWLHGELDDLHDEDFAVAVNLGALRSIQ